MISVGCRDGGGTVSLHSRPAVGSVVALLRSSTGGRNRECVVAGHVRSRGVGTHITRSVIPPKAISSSDVVTRGICTRLPHPSPSVGKKGRVWSSVHRPQ